MTADATRARLVAGAKVALPLMALALLSTVFLLARTVDPDDAIPFAEIDLSERARDEQLTRPRVMGQSRGGTGFDLAADAARPDPAAPAVLTIDRLRLALDDAGAGATVSARGGRVDTRAREVVLDGDVVVETTTGYRLRTERLEGSLGALRLVAPAPVHGDGPLGRLDAGGMVLEEQGGAQRLRFTGGVDLLYVPPTP